MLINTYHINSLKLPYINTISRKNNAYRQTMLINTYHNNSLKLPYINTINRKNNAYRQTGQYLKFPICLYI